MMYRTNLSKPIVSRGDAKKLVADLVKNNEYGQFLLQKLLDRGPNYDESVSAICRRAGIEKYLPDYDTYAKSILFPPIYVPNKDHTKTYRISNYGHQYGHTDDAQKEAIDYFNAWSGDPEDIDLFDVEEVWKPDVYVRISGGCMQQVRASFPVNVCLYDEDNAAGDDPGFKWEDVDVPAVW